MLTYRKENKKMKNLLYFVAGFGAGIAAIKLEQKYGYCEKLIGNVKKKITGDGIEEVKEIPAEEKN
jgi:hypothetical protein|nr:MAG: hypothetical protein [Bacteriophage sp.]